MALQNVQQMNGSDNCSGSAVGSGCSSGAENALTSSPGSRIPRPLPKVTSPTLKRSSSLRLRGERRYTTDQHHNHLEHFPVITENTYCSPKKSSASSLSLTPSRKTHLEDCCSDNESVKSFSSNYSTSSACDHATFALNGTTWSGRSKKYVIHCSSAQNDDSSEYLTPTQRAARQVRKFQTLLKEAKKEIEEKEKEIFRLTKELVELRLYKASLSSPDEKTDSSGETSTIRENKSFTLDSPTKSLTDKASSSFLEPTTTAPTSPARTLEKKDTSLVDSGHFEDGSMHSNSYSNNVVVVADNTSSISSTSRTLPLADDIQVDQYFSPELRISSASGLIYQNEERKKIVDHYENRIEEMHRRYVDEMQLLKQTHNDKIESLLNQLAEMSSRFCESRPSLDTILAQAKESEALVEVLKSELAEQKALLADQEERNKQVYLKMYSKGQQAARMEQADQIVVLEEGQKNSKITVADLLQQLTITQAELENIKAMYRRIVESRNSQGALDPEITLQFLKSAIYYFLTDKDNLQGHLNAIESILGFTDSEKLNIDRIYRAAKK